MDYQQEFWGPREKKSYRCRDCGRTRQEAKEIDVHHIDPQGPDTDDNLIGLCRRCHLEARHRRESAPGQHAFAPDTPSGTGPSTPTGLGPA
jgi:5-methylcytosine-specific restriction endonuclease McrA